MGKGRCFVFGPYCLDALDARLWRHDVTVPLGQKAFGVLAQLVDHANTLVTKDNLLTSVWAETAVSEAVLTTAMREIRLALGDSAHAPHFIQTVYGRGYRFIAPVVEVSARPPMTGASVEARHLVGREDELKRLREWYAAALQGRRRIGFIAGEAGIGKTALVDGFVAEIAAMGVVRIGRGQCIEQYGAGEAYLPILEALEHLGRERDVALVQAFHEHAPTWLEHLPSLARHGAESSVGVRPERMLRELTRALEAVTVTAPLVLVLEDLHWSDTATLEWLSSVARRREASRLLVLGTYRPDEALDERPAKAPLRNVLAELRQQPQSDEIALDGLSRDAVHAYLQGATGRIDGLETLMDVVHRRTGGHPLFVASIVDELIGSGRAHPASRTTLDLVAMTHAMPLSVRRFIEYRFERLPAEDQMILEAASVAGDPFSIAAVAAATSLPEDRIEARCATWTRIFVADGLAPWPDGTLAARYRFRHALFHEAAYTRISPEGRARLHLMVGRRLEAAYGLQAPAIATELAVHFEQGRDPGRAATYLEQSARSALSRSAYAEARRHLDRALTMARYLPEGRDRRHREATLFLLLAHVLESTRGWSDDDVERCFARARELWLALADEPHVLQATWGLVAVSLVRGELRKTRILSRDMLVLAKKRKDNLFRMAAHVELGGTRLMLAEASSARRHFRLAEVLSTRHLEQSAVTTFGMDLAIFGRMWATHVTWYEGDPERARADAAGVLAAAGAIDHPFTWTVALAYAAMLDQFRQDVGELDRLCSLAIAQASAHGFAYYLAWAEVLRGWSLAVQGAGGEAVDAMRRSLEVLRATAGLRLPYYRALLADACGRIGRIDEGLDAIAAGFDEARKTDERWWEPELHRIRGELLRLVGGENEAEQCFRTAIELARRQRARSLELRATDSLARIVIAR